MAQCGGEGRPRFVIAMQKSEAASLLGEIVRPVGGADEGPFHECQGCAGPTPRQRRHAEQEMGIRMLRSRGEDTPTDAFSRPDLAATQMALGVPPPVIDGRR